MKRAKAFLLPLIHFHNQMWKNVVDFSNRNITPRPSWLKALIISLLFTVFYAALLLPTSLGYIGKYINIAEQQQAELKLESALQFISYQMANMESMVRDWSAWDDTYQFILDLNEDYIENNLWGESFSALDIDLFALVDTEGKVVFYRFYVPSGVKEDPVTFNVQELINLYPDLLEIADRDGKVSTAALVENKPMLVSARPVLDSLERGPSHGTLIYMRYINDFTINQVREVTRQTVTFTLDADLPSELKESAQAAAGEPFSKIIDAKTIAGFQMLTDLHGDPVGLFEVRSERNLSAYAKSIQQFYYLSYFGSSLLFFIVLFLIFLLLFRSRRAEQISLSRLRESQERYTLALAGSMDGIWDWDLKTNEIYFSDRWRNQLGLLLEDQMSKPNDWINLIHPDDRDVFQTELMKHRRMVTDHFECNYRILCKDGTYRWMKARGQALWDKEAFPYRIAGSQTDITEEKIQEAQLRRGALYDPLTKLPNRTLFEDRLNRAFSRDARIGELSFGLIYLSINRFKQINENYGYAAGDQVLIEISQRIRKCIRTSIDTPSRLVADEYMIILEDVHSLEDLEHVANRLKGELDHPIHFQDHSIHLSYRLVVYRPQTEQQELTKILQDVVLAANFMRSPGKSSLVVLDNELLYKIREHLDMENELRAAVDNQEFILHYQPIYSLETGKITRLEALIRWNHPQRGIIPPSAFIPLLETTGLIIPVGLWTLRTGCNQLKSSWAKYPESRNVILHVNLSVAQFVDVHLAERIAQILREVDFPANQLCMEITETILMEDLESTIHILNQLKDMGVHVEIDDFGTGYSSFSYLKTLPVDGIKIDRSFISNLDSDVNEREIVRTILDLSKTLGLYGIAEGVETFHQYKILKEMNCSYFQGFYLNRPVEWSMIEKLLAENYQQQAGKSGGE